MNETENPRPSVTISKRRMRSRRKRLFLYGLFVMLCILIIPAVIIPPWLASKGIEINAISGINFNQGLVINEVSISINRNALTLRKLSLEHFVDTDSAISNSSWRLFSKQTEVRLSPDVLDALKQQGIRLSALTLKETAFNFTDLSEPYVFSAHANSIEASLFDNNNTAVKQQIEDIDLVLTTQPAVVISGYIRHGALNLLIPGDKAANQYPFEFDKANFSISWQPYNTPLSVHVTTLKPKWPTATQSYTQQGKNIALGLDLKHAQNTIKLTADSLWLDQPSQLPEFIEKPDNTNQGLHLGRAIAKLSLLPLRKLKIHDFNYGELIIHSLLVLETPKKRMNKPDKKARLKLVGKALGPDPYDIDVLVEHINEQDAHFSGTIAGPKGNKLQCLAKLHFSSPLPTSLNCHADFQHTKELTDRLKLYGMPNASLSEPLTIQATQTAFSQDSASTITTTADTPASQSSNSNQELSPTETLSRSLDSITKAQYQITITLPRHIKVDLNQYTFQHPMHNSPDSPETKATVSTLSFSTDGTLTFDALYQDEKLIFELSEPSEEIAMESPRHDTFFSLLFKKLYCSIKFDRHHPSNSLQCNSSAHFQSRIQQLFPTIDSQLDTISASSDVDLNWSSTNLTLQFQQNRFNVAQAVLPVGATIDPSFIHSQATDLSLQAGSIELSQSFEHDSPPQLKLQLAPDAEILLTSDFYGEKLITEEAVSAQFRKRLLRNKKQLPVQKYDAKLTLALKDAMLRHSNGQLNITTHYQTSLNLKQNNQRLPPFSSQGTLTLEPDTFSIAGVLNSAINAQLVKFSIKSDLQRDQTKIKLHRNDISFDTKRSLKKHYLPRLPIKYDLNSGKVGFNADLLLNKGKLNGNFAVFADGLGGYIHGFHFADLNVSFNAVLTPEGIHSTYPVSLHAGLLHAGVLLENIFALIEFDTGNNHYALHRASAYLLGGSISTHGVTSSSLTNIPHIPILVHRLDLEKLIQAIEPNDVELTGTLDGSLPLSIQSGLPAIQNGKLHSRFPGGVLRYKEGSAIDRNVEAAGENSLMVISKILKNYKYDSLAVDIDYSKEGQLNASSRFKGYNPDFQNGRPIYINLNIEDDIPALIKTLNAINSSKLEGQFLKQLGLDE
ncbi:hypothetical protein EIZ48_05770 [Photobacterium alginatilyticum]|uniref:Dicarboxylate transport domain-containing protein n=2 Tax=Photobacterium alginatilyticum TaxID=1775171 RepID=A0ABW9YE64_9GAMM|nr:hypothetical protein [Photobacterium alginatilyticum]